MSIFQGVPGPSQEEFDDLNEYVAVLTGLTSGIKTIALNSTYCPDNSVRWVNTSTTNTSDLPNGNSRYGLACIRRRNSSSISISLYPESGDEYTTGYNGTSWSSWISIATLNNQITSLSNGVDISSQITLETGAYIDSARKYGNLIAIVGRFTKITTANTGRVLATIASGYRPAQTTSGSVTVASPQDFGYGVLTLTNAGELSVIFSKTTTYGMFFNITYPVS